MSNTDNVRYVMTDYPYNWRDGDFDDWLNEIKREAWTDAKKNPEDFIAAVETELNGIFISKDDLPTEFVRTLSTRTSVTVLNDGEEVFQFNPEYDTYESLRQSALNVLAAAEYLKKNPPVNQKQVDALAQILADNENWPVEDLHKDVARKILASGKVSVTTND